MKLHLTSLGGDHYQLGLQQGKAARKSIHKLLESLTEFKVYKYLKPNWLPSPVFLYLAKHRASNQLEKDIPKYYPRQAERLRGLAEGSEIDLSTLLFLQSFELLIGAPRYKVEACTAIGFSAQKTMNSEVILVKNFDYLNDLEPYQVAYKAAPDGCYRTLGFTISPLPCMLEGMNEHGLSVTYNLAYTTDKPSCYVPLSMVIQEMLETCRDTDEAVKYLREAKRGGHDAILTIVDPSGDFRSVEITSNHIATRKMEKDYLINANQFQTSEMKRYEIPHNAVSLIDGTRVHESSEERMKRIHVLLKNKNKVDEGDIIAILRDHGPEDKPSANTICRHDEIASTLRSMIYHPEKRTIKALHGRACINEYLEIQLQS